MDPVHLDKIEELFHAALQKPPADRSIFIRQACTRDPALRREVESLLAADRQAGQFMQEPLFAKGALTVCDQLTAHQPAGIGAYKVIRPLGEGTGTVVYLAVRADAQYQRRVAIKVVQPGMGTEQILHRFWQERQIIAGLDHPNIAKLLDGGNTEDGRPYFVMEYIEGMPIDDYCNGHKLSVEERLELFRSVCAAVYYAHQNLVVHRDLKPANILVTVNGVPKLLDFGIAKLLNPELLSQNIEPTAPLFRLMTPHYASPEQVWGKAITTASDVYSLGVILYKLLTGHRPYQLSHRSPREIERIICETDPMPPSMAIEPSTRWQSHRAEPGKPEVAWEQPEAPDRLRRYLKGELDNIVLMAMRKEPEHRYASVQELSEDIWRHLKRLPIMAQRNRLTYRATKWLRGRLTGVVVACLGVCLLLVGISVIAWQMRVANQERARADVLRIRVEVVSSFLLDLFKLANPNEAKIHRMTVREALDRGAEQIRHRLEDQPKIKATLMETMSGIYRSLGLYDQAVRLGELALQTLRQRLAEEKLEIADSLHTLTLALLAKGDLDAAEARCREALAIRQDRLGQQHPSVVESLKDLAAVLRAKGDHLGARKLLHRAQAL